MLKHDPQYTRLSHGKSFMGVASSYWLGPDHLLVVRVDSFTERYQRFAYRDIQAILTRRTLRYAIINTVCLIFLLPTLLALMIGGQAARLGMIAPAILLTVAIWVNLWKGATCAYYLQTAVQTDKLPGLNRVRTGRRAIDQLKTRIDQVQSVQPNPVA